ncbi:MAG: hypothetical protein JW768_02030 [Chitinispirillaceae bacterium]|nr:hypothetical protein [Chitinispirillaceae bacterium]
MNKGEENKLSMYKGVAGVLHENETITSTVPAFATGASELDASITEIQDRDKEYQGVTAGAVAAKNSAEDVLVARTMKIASALSVLGRRIGNEEPGARVIFKMNKETIKKGNGQ